MQMTASLEDYLEAIYILELKDGEARMTSLSALLGVTKPSANRAVRTLGELGYLTHESYGAIVLTTKGKEAAADVLRRHTTIKAFLRDTLHVEEATAERDACRMEHVMSGETMEKLLAFLESMEGRGRNA